MGQRRDFNLNKKILNVSSIQRNCNTLKSYLPNNGFNKFFSHQQINSCKFHIVDTLCNGLMVYVPNPL